MQFIIPGEDAYEVVLAKMIIDKRPEVDENVCFSMRWEFLVQEDYEKIPKYIESIAEGSGPFPIYKITLV